MTLTVPIAEIDGKPIVASIIGKTQRAGAIALMLDLLVVRSAYTWPGLLIAVSGAPIYLWRQHMYRPRLTDSV